MKEKKKKQQQNRKENTYKAMTCLLHRQNMAAVKSSICNILHPCGKHPSV